VIQHLPDIGLRRLFVFAPPQGASDDADSGVLVALLLLVAVIGYFRGWFQAESHDVNGHDTITVTVDKAKLNQDKARAEQDIQALEHKLGKTFGDATAMRKLWPIIWCLTGVTSSCWVGGCCCGAGGVEIPQYPQYVQYPRRRSARYARSAWAQVTLTATR